MTRRNPQYSPIISAPALNSPTYETFRNPVYISEYFQSDSDYNDGLSPDYWTSDDGMASVFFEKIMCKIDNIGPVYSVIMKGVDNTTECAEERIVYKYRNLGNFNLLYVLSIEAERLEATIKRLQLSSAAP